MRSSCKLSFEGFTSAFWAGWVGSDTGLEIKGKEQGQILSPVDKCTHSFWIPQRNSRGKAGSFRVPRMARGSMETHKPRRAELGQRGRTGARRAKPGQGGQNRGKEGRIGAGGQTLVREGRTGAGGQTLVREGRTGAGRAMEVTCPVSSSIPFLSSEKKTIFFGNICQAEVQEMFQR